MPNLPTPAQLKEAMLKVAKDFTKGPNPVTSIRRVEVVAYRRGVPRLRVVSNSPIAPAKFPAGLALRLRNGSIYNLPIEWFYDVTRSDRQMWGGASDVTDRPRQEIVPWSEHAPLLNSEQKMPANDVVEYQLIVNSRLPQFSVPNFWSEPFHPSDSVCTPYYETFYYPYRFRVPADRMVMINSVSYEFANAIADFEQFTVGILRENEVMAEWTDMKVPGSTNPAEQYAFAGHYRPIPVYCRVDHDQTIVVRVKVKGAYPYTHLDTDVLGGCFTVCLNGWMASLMDNRDGGARPVDMGDFNDMALGFMDPERPMDEDLNRVL